MFAPSKRGDLALVSRMATSGQGTGAGLGSQGAVTLSGDGRHAVVVNAASNTVSAFAIRHDGVALTSTVDSGGLTSISVTEHDGVVYVLNSGVGGNVAGSRNEQGQLRRIANGSRAPSAAGGTGPAQIGVDGDVLAATERSPIGSPPSGYAATVASGRSSRPRRPGRLHSDLRSTAATT